MLVAAGGSRSMARACALLSEGRAAGRRAIATTDSDLLSALDQWDMATPQVKRAADLIVDRGSRNTDSQNERAFRRAVLAGYPDRVAQRREPGSPEVLLSSGTGATMGSESGVRGGEFLVALDITRNSQSANPQYSVVRAASAIDREWLTATVSETVHRFDAATGRVRAAIVDRYDALLLAERPVPVDPEIAAPLLADAWLARGPRDEDVLLLRRLRFIGQDADVPALVRMAAYGARSLDEVRIEQALAPDVLRALASDAPESLTVPSGRQTALSYNDDGSVSASVKLQELFGLAETPRVGRQREPVVLSLLAPNGRPVQVTRDLRSFWDRTYPEVRKELRGRYPKHPWPEDPWTAPPTARTKRNSKVRT
jgi:ATP-dependent helicase HrpB